MIPGGGMVVLLLSVQQHSVRFNMSLPLLEATGPTSLGPTSLGPTSHIKPHRMLLY